MEFGSTPLFNDSNCIHYYKLEDVTDSKGSNNLTNNNSVVFDAAKFNNGADLGAANTNKYLNLAGNNGYTGGAFSMSFWMKLNAEIASSTWNLLDIIDSGSHTELNIDYEFNGGTRRIRTSRARSGVGTDIGAYTVTLGTSLFHFLVFSYDGSTVNFYFDNSLAITFSSSGNGSSVVTSGFALGVSNGLFGYTSAIFDDLVLFNRALTATEVSELYTGDFGFNQELNGNNIASLAQLNFYKNRKERYNRALLTRLGNSLYTEDFSSTQQELRGNNFASLAQRQFYTKEVKAF